jgi:hypothetical protein
MLKSELPHEAPNPVSNRRREFIALLGCGVAWLTQARSARANATREPIGDTGTKVTPHQGCCMKGKFTALGWCRE